MEYEIKKQQFIELRAEELSLDKISKEINISKPTLIKWCRELEIEIHNQKSIIIDSIKDEFQITRKKNLETMKETFLGIEKELLSRDFKDLASDKLFKLYSDMRAQLTKDLEVTYKKEESFNVDFFSNTVATWTL